MPAAQMERFYGSRETAEMYLYMGYAFRAFNTHGRAMFTLAHRAMAGYDESDYMLTDGERICSTAIGWNFGDGHMHNEQLIAALQERCHFEPGEVRIVLIDAQPIHRQTQQYRLVDAATGEFETRLRQSGRYGDPPAVGRRRAGLCGPDRGVGAAHRSRFSAIARSPRSLGGAAATSAHDVADLDGLQTLQQQIARGVEVLAPMCLCRSAVARPQ